MRIEKNQNKRKELISKKNTICEHIFHKIQMKAQKYEDSIERVSINTQNLHKLLEKLELTPNYLIDSIHLNNARK